MNRMFDSLNVRTQKEAKTPFVLWFTGLSGAGKSTLAGRINDYLIRKQYKVECLDGDVIRSFLPQTGFTKEERNQHIKRVGFLASLLERNRIIVIASFISPYRETRQSVRALCQNFVEVYVKASLEKCLERDVKGLYKKARNGEIKNFTGIDDPYEEPVNPEIIVETDRCSVEECFQAITEYINRYLD